MTEAISMGIHGGVATRDDIAEVRAEIAELRTEVRAEIAGVKKDLKWMKAIGGLIIALLVIPYIRELLQVF